MGDLARFVHEHQNGSYHQFSITNAEQLEGIIGALAPVKDDTAPGLRVCSMRRSLIAASNSTEAYNQVV